MEVEAGETAPGLIQWQEKLCLMVLMGGPHVHWPSPSSNGRPLVVLEVEVGLAQLEVVEVDTEVILFPHFCLQLCPLYDKCYFCGMTACCEIWYENVLLISPLITQPNQFSKKETRLSLKPDITIDIFCSNFQLFHFHH